MPKWCSRPRHSFSLALFSFIFSPPLLYLNLSILLFSPSNFCKRQSEHWAVFSENTASVPLLFPLRSFQQWCQSLSLRKDSPWRLEKGRMQLCFCPLPSKQKVFEDLLVALWDDRSTLEVDGRLKTSTHSILLHAWMQCRKFESLWSCYSR